VKNILSAEQRSSALYRSAYQCAENKSKRLCNGYCGNCPFNVSLYADDPREAVLIKTSAALDQHKVAEAEHTRSLKGWVWLYYIIVTVVLIHGCLSGCRVEPELEQQPPPVNASRFWIEIPPDYPPLPPYCTLPQTTPLDLVTILWTDAGFYDVNKDGKINCIDQNVLLFALAEPGKRRLIAQKNPESSLYHLFTELLIYNKWYYVDASAGPPRWDPVEIWGSRYDPKYNSDATVRYGVYAPNWRPTRIK
jgi:hypothetical protein